MDTFCQNMKHDFFKFKSQFDLSITNSQNVLSGEEPLDDSKQGYPEQGAPSPLQARSSRSPDPSS